MNTRMCFTSSQSIVTHSKGLPSQGSTRHHDVSPRLINVVSGYFDRSPVDRMESWLTESTKGDCSQPTRIQHGSQNRTGKLFGYCQVKEGDLILKSHYIALTRSSVLSPFARVNYGVFEYALGPSKYLRGSLRKVHRPLKLGAFCFLALQSNLSKRVQMSSVNRGNRAKRLNPARQGTGPLPLKKFHALFSDVEMSRPYPSNDPNDQCCSQKLSNPFTHCTRFFLLHLAPISGRRLPEGEVP